MENKIFEFIGYMGISFGCFIMLLICLGVI